MKISVVKEAREGETRVALVPEAVAKLVAAGHDIAVESGAGADAQFSDAEYAEAGAQVGQPNLCLLYTSDAADE